MVARKALGSLALLIWLGTLAFVSGPVRWEYAHSYAHLVEDAGNELPLLTVVIALPVLGLASPTFGSVLLQLVFWSVTWLGPVAILFGVWRAENQSLVTDRLVYGGGLYGSVIVLFATLVAVSLRMPFWFL